MKKIIIALTLTFGVILAGSYEDNIKSIIEKETSTKINVVKYKDFKDNKALRVAVIEIENELQQIPVITNKEGDMIIGLSNLFFTKSINDENIVKEIANEILANNENKEQKAAAPIIEKLQPNEYVSIKSDAKDPKTYFIISDPNCGYCREELRRVEEKLKTHNINMVVVGMLGEDSLKRSAYILSKVNDNMNNAEKLKIIRDAYSNNFKTPKTIDTSKVKTTTDGIFSSGVIRGTPFIYEK